MNAMKFSIITPTFKRKDLLKRAVESLLKQTYQDWEMIIVNDSPTDKQYHEFSSSINDARIHYHINDFNRGVNYSRNFGLNKISADSKWIIFLDDDDYFSPDALQTFHDLILLHQDIHWFVTNRAYTTGKSLTKFPQNNSFYSYAWDYLILRRCKGDATHCIDTKLINLHKIEFSQRIKQGEEWLFFYQVGLYSKIFYHDHNSTITNGYDLVSGLNFRRKNHKEEFKTLLLLYEASHSKRFYNISFFVYIGIRTLKIPLQFLRIIK